MRQCVPVLVDKDKHVARFSGQADVSGTFVAWWTASIEGGRAAKLPHFGDAPVKRISIARARDMLRRLASTPIGADFERHRLAWVAVPSTITISGLEVALEGERVVASARISVIRRFERPTIAEASSVSAAPPL